MSPREKKLLLFFAAAGFLVLNFLVIGFFKSKRIEVDRQRDEARQKLDVAEMFRASREQVVDEMDWLAKHEPEPAANQDVQTKLQQLCEREAKTTGLTIKTQKPLPTEASAGLQFHRAKIQLTVNGTEQALYQWFDRLNIPEQLRIASSIRLSPNKEDDTKIDCTAIIEQWFVPVPPSV
jgi:type II secretory pathway component PulM